MILVTNDDGVYSPGILILAKRLRELDTVVIVAPDRERSAAGHSMTLHRPLLIEEIKEGIYSVNGTPTDCVNIAVKGMLKETPRLVDHWAETAPWPGRPGVIAATHALAPVVQCADGHASDRLLDAL